MVTGRPNGAKHAEQLAKARRALRGVDSELLQFGPRRALWWLRVLKLEAPFGTAKQYSDYEEVLVAMIRRREWEELDADVERCGEEAVWAHSKAHAGAAAVRSHKFQAT